MSNHIEQEENVIDDAINDILQVRTWCGWMCVHVAFGYEHAIFKTTFNIGLSRRWAALRHF